MTFLYNKQTYSHMYKKTMPTSSAVNESLRSSSQENQKRPAECRPIVRLSIYIDRVIKHSINYLVINICLFQLAFIYIDKVTE